MVLDEIRRLKIVPVIVIDDAERALGLADALSGGGLPCAEITFRTHGRGRSAAAHRRRAAGRARGRGDGADHRAGCARPGRRRSVHRIPGHQPQGRRMVPGSLAASVPRGLHADGNRDRPRVRFERREILSGRTLGRRRVSEGHRGSISRPVLHAHGRHHSRERARVSGVQARGRVRRVVDGAPGLDSAGRVRSRPRRGRCPRCRRSPDPCHIASSRSARSCYA